MSRRGRSSKFTHKGRSRCFTAPDEMQRQFEQARRQEDSPDEDKEENQVEPVEEKSSEESEEEDQGKKKGVHGLIEIENPNRAPAKTKKVENIENAPKVQLSRREKEEIEKQRATQRYEQLHSQGKTEEARKDLERLALIRQKREEQAAKKKLDEEAKEAAIKNPSSAFKKKSTPGQSQD